MDRPLAPGVAEALAVASPATPADSPAPPRFIGGASRSTAIALDWPVAYDGVEYREVVLRRLSVGEVAAFLERIKDQAADAKVTFPVFRTADDCEIPEAVLTALDDDDMARLDEAAASFLPRRFPGRPGQRFLPAEWRYYRALIRRAIGWDMAVLMAMAWDEFLAELGEARSLEGMT